MTISRSWTLVPLAVFSLALGISPLGCGGDGKATGTGGTGGVVLPAAGGRGGSGTGGSGRGGTGGNSPGSAGTGGVAMNGGAGGTAGGGAGGAGGQDASVNDTSMGAGGAGGAPVDAPVVVDTAPPVDLPPDTAPVAIDTAPPTTTVDVTTCSQINCPRFIAVTSPCVASETTCESDVTMEDPQLHTSYCHSNGVKKFAKTVFASTGSAYTTTMEVLQQSGAACYTLEIRGTASGDADVQSWTYKSPAGEQVATATWIASSSQLTITCDNVNYRIGDVGCPGTDGQPDREGGDCPDGSCSR